MDKFHRAFGVYGIIGNQHEMIVIKKNGGPYINRYDLPGGSLDEGESLSNAIVREIKEETGLNATNVNQLGTTSFKYPWKYEKYIYNQHICVFYSVNEIDGNLKNSVQQFEGQDSLGALIIELADLSLDNASPLVLKAKEYLLTNQFDEIDTTYETWEVLEKTIY